MDGRRTLNFAGLDEVMPEVDRLLQGHRTLGNWSLGQIGNHLMGSFQSSVEGYPGSAPWLVRKLIGPVVKRRLFSTGRIAEGATLPAEYAPKPGLDARAEAEALRAAIRLFAAHSGPMAPHPLFGRMTAEEWQRFHCIHAAHHLGFVVPVAPPG